MKNKYYLFIIFAGLILDWTSIHADGIATDGTMGALQSLSGADIAIPQSLGTTVGRNLFHSFSDFNIANDQTVEFTGGNALENVISRVTGDHESNIDGTLKSSIANAEFYFINPNGITFGKNAWVDVPGSFHFSTAGQINFKDGGRFSANAADAGTLSSALPAKFGFLGTSAANNGLIAVNAGQLAVNSGHTLDLVAGNITVASSADQNAALVAPDGEIRLVAMQGEGLVSLINTGRGLALPQQSSPAEHGGTIFVDGRLGKGYATLYAKGNGAGRVAAWGRELGFSDAVVYADNNGAAFAGLEKGISFQTQALNIDQSLIQSDALSTGNSGNIIIDAETMALSNGTFIASDANGAGKAGKIAINAGDLSMTGEAFISSSTWGDGDAGRVLINADKLRIDGMGSGDPTGIASSTHSGSTGQAGLVKITADKLNLINHGVIASNTWSNSDAGHVKVKVGTLRIDGQSSQYSTGLLSYAYDGRGSGGTVSADVGRLEIVNGGEISSNAWSDGNAGIVRVKTGSLLIDRQGSRFFTGIFSDVYAGSSGSGGQVSISAEDIKLVNEGVISSSTWSKGNAGNIAIRTGSLLIDGTGAEEGFTGIHSDSIEGGSGDAGTISINADDLKLVEQGFISTSTFTSGNAGDIRISADRLIIDGQGFASTTGIFSRSLTEHSDSKAGSITLRINDQLQLEDARLGVENVTISKHAAQIEPSAISITAPIIALNNCIILTESPGNVGAGAITIDSLEEMTMTNSKISSKAVSGSGSIAINAGKALKLAFSHISTENLFGNAGAITIKVGETLQLTDSVLQTNVYAAHGDGGAITINGGNLIRLTNSGLLTTVYNALGNGGDISMTGDNVIMDNGAIQANALSGQGGAINLNLKALIPSGNSLLLGGRSVVWTASGSGFNVIQAVSENGISGNINLTAPQLHLSGVLANFGGPQLDTEGINQDVCLTTTGSSLTRSGAGSLKPKAADLGF